VAAGNGEPEGKGTGTQTIDATEDRRCQFGGKPLPVAALACVFRQRREQRFVAGQHDRDTPHLRDQPNQRQMNERRGADVEHVEFTCFHPLQQPQAGERKQDIRAAFANAARIEESPRARQPHEPDAVDRLVARAGGVDAHVVPLPRQLAREGPRPALVPAAIKGFAGIQQEPDGHGLPRTVAGGREGVHPSQQLQQASSSRAKSRDQTRRRLKGNDEKLTGCPPAALKGTVSGPSTSRHAERGATLRMTPLFDYYFVSGCEERGLFDPEPKGGGAQRRLIRRSQIGLRPIHEWLRIFNSADARDCRYFKNHRFVSRSRVPLWSSRRACARWRCQ
jgi:hypothetical protein